MKVWNLKAVQETLSETGAAAHRIESDSECIQHSGSKEDTELYPSSRLGDVTMRIVAAVLL